MDPAAAALHPIEIRAPTQSEGARETLRTRGSGPGAVTQCRLLGAVGASRVRPFRRRRDNTLRPPGVAIRARNPWARRRLIFEGWYVRFITDSR